MSDPTQLGPYLIADQLGRGGMGCVYRATHHETHDEVAIKALASHLSGSEGFRDRFQSEIDSLRKLRHRGIVSLIGHGEQDGVLFYAMELIDGPSLEQELRNGRRFTWRETTQVAIQVSRALKHAHDHGVVHRDIKPANLLLTPGGDVKVADFGIARLFGSTGTTIAGGVLGTADYMSPEQAAGQPVTARCDQYALGCVMYALLSGRTPFRAADVADMLQMQRYATAESVRRIAPDTPIELDRVIQQLLEKDPQQRFPNTKVLARHLEAMLQAFAKPRPDGFEIAEAETPAVASSVLDEGLAETRDAHSDPPVVQALSKQADPDQPTPVGQAAVAPPSIDSHYTAVEPSGDDSAGGARFALGSVAVLLLAMGALGGVAYWWTRPLTSDQLYVRIETQREAGASAKADIDRFLQLYPTDARADEVVQLAGETELEQMRKRMALVTLLRERLGKPAPPEEMLYRNAMSLRSSDPELAADAFDALATIARNEAEKDADEAERLGLLAKLAGAEAASLRRVQDAESTRLFEYLRRQLGAARKKLASGDAAGATALARAIVNATPAGQRYELLAGEAERLATEAAGQRGVASAP
ncbi:MAG: serine/threonine-protein kinase [Planctomycetota bacterium]